MNFKVTLNLLRVEFSKIVKILKSNNWILIFSRFSKIIFAIIAHCSGYLEIEKNQKKYFSSEVIENFVFCVTLELIPKGYKAWFSLAMKAQAQA